MLPLEGLSEKLWSDICRIGQVLDAEYTSRRETLIKRADCTVQSFKWSDRAKVRDLTLNSFSTNITSSWLTTHLQK